MFLILSFCFDSTSSFPFPTPFRQIRYISAKLRSDVGQIRTPDDAVELFSEMVRSNSLPSVIEFTKLLSIVVKMIRFSVALSLFDELLQRKVHVIDYTLNISVNCFSLLSRVDDGVAILGSFLKRELVKGVFKIEKHVDAEIFCGKLLGENLWEVSVVRYGIVLDGMCKAGHTVRANDLLKWMDQQRCKPDILAYTSVIDGFCKDKMVNEALQLFSKLLDKGAVPKFVTYSSIVHGLCKCGRLEEGEDILKNMVARDWLLFVFWWKPYCWIL